MSSTNCIRRGGVCACGGGFCGVDADHYGRPGREALAKIRELEVRIAGPIVGLPAVSDSTMRVQKYLNARGEGASTGRDHIHGYGGNTPLLVSDLKIILAALKATPA